MLVARIAQALVGYLHYGNPVQLLTQRAMGNRLKLFNIKDRASGVACWCTPNSHRMFAETWFHKNYDVSGAALRSGDVVLDIGANQGFFSCYAGLKGARVIAFEPDRNNFALLERNVIRNGLGQRVEARCEAVGARTGRVDFYTSPYLGGGMNTTTARFAARFGHSKTAPVACVALGEVLDSLSCDRVRLCKLDCEGAELEILSSLSPSHTQRIDAVALEYHTDAYEVADLVDCILGWGTHHLAFVRAVGPPLAMLHAVSPRVLREFAQTL